MVMDSGCLEVVRTMHQAKVCFTQEVIDELEKLKKLLALFVFQLVRMSVS